MERVTREKQVSVPVSAMYRAITDFVAYPEFISEVVAAEVLPDATETRARVRFELEVIKKFEYILEFQMKVDQEVKWSLHESNFFKTNEGLWRLKSTGESSTHVDYEVEVGFGFLVPKWIVKKLTSNSLPKMLESFAQRAQQLQ